MKQYAVTIMNLTTKEEISCLTVCRKCIDFNEAVKMTNNKYFVYYYYVREDCLYSVISKE